MSEPEEDDDIASVLAGWGLTPTQVAETLEATDFGLGLIELRAAAGQRSPGIAIVVDDRRDREMREVFDWRDATSEEEYAATWEVGEAPFVRVVLGPDEQALVRFAVTIRAPKALERRFLFAVGVVAPQLAKLQVAGTGIWLVPGTVIEKEAAREGPVDAYDVLGRCLRAGTVAKPVPSIDEALAHVGAPRDAPSGGPPPMNRAERRAAERNAKKKG